MVASRSHGTASREESQDALVIVDGSNVAHLSEIVSNDRFRDRQKAFPEAAKRLIRYMVVKGEVVLERRTGQRHD